MVRGSLCAVEKNEITDQEQGTDAGSKAETKTLHKQESHSVNPLQQELIYATDNNIFLQAFNENTRSSKLPRKSQQSMRLSVDQHKNIDISSTHLSNPHMSQEIKELLHNQTFDPNHDSQITAAQALSPAEMTVRTIPNLQVDKIMIRKKRNKSSKLAQEGLECAKESSRREYKVKWKIVKQTLQSPKTVLSQNKHLSMNRKKKSTEELSQFLRHQTNASSTVLGRRAKGLKTLCDLTMSPRPDEN